MNDELLKIAQAEYQRQYDDWLRMMPKKKKVEDSIEDIINKYIERLRLRSDSYGQNRDTYTVN